MNDFQKVMEPELGKLYCDYVLKKLQTAHELLRGEGIGKPYGFISKGLGGGEYRDEFYERDVPYISAEKFKVRYYPLGVPLKFEIGSSIINWECNQIVEIGDGYGSIGVVDTKIGIREKAKKPLTDLIGTFNGIMKKFGRDDLAIMMLDDVLKPNIGNKRIARTISEMGKKDDREIVL